MSSKNLTFDPTAGVPYAANLTLYSGVILYKPFPRVRISQIVNLTRDPISSYS